MNAAPQRPLLISYLGLIATHIWWQDWFANDLLMELRANWTIYPLLLFVYGIARGSYRSAVLAAFLTLFYFVYAVSEAMISPSQRIPALIETSCCIAVYISLLHWAAIRRALARTLHEYRDEIGKIE